MKKFFAITAILLAFANVALADKVTNFNTGNGDVTWSYLDLGGDPSYAYTNGGTNGNGAAFLADGYATAQVINPQHPNWLAWPGDNAPQWIGPSANAAEENSTKQGYTAYNANGFKTNQSSINVSATADNAVANIFIGFGDGIDDYIDLMSDAYKAFVMIGYNIENEYEGPEYNGNPYGSQGLFSGTMDMIIDWAGLTTQLGWNAEGTYDWYFIVQNTNPSNSTSPTGFAATFSGTTGENIDTTPEPATMLIIGLGFAGAGIAARRRKAK